MTGAMVATAIVVWPAAPFFLFMHGKDVTIPKGTKITAYVDGEIKLDRAKFVGAIPAQPVAQPAAQGIATLSASATAPAPAPIQVVTFPAPQSQPPDTQVVSLPGAPKALALVPTPTALPAAPRDPVQPPQPTKPAAQQVDLIPQPKAPLVTPLKPAEQPLPVEPTQPTQPPQAEAKLELGITSDPIGAAVEVNGVSVGATPVKVALTPNAACTISVKKDGFVPWTMHYPASVAGKFNLNANLTKEVFR
jgi:hypothetical protein